MAENNYFKKEGDYIYLNAPECRFYIPEDYFESTAGFAQDRGEMIYMNRKQKVFYYQGQMNQRYVEYLHFMKVLKL